jgi:ComF family protein
VQLSAPVKRIGAWLLRAACPLCGQAITPEQDFCTGCERALPVIATACARCAAPLDHIETTDAICGQCEQTPPVYAAVHAPYRYAPPIDRLVHGAKYGARLDWATLLGRRLAEHLVSRADSIDVLVPVPLHRSRLRERGYNQSLELARLLEKRLRIPLTHGVDRVRATPPQTTLSREERRRNVRRAFAAARDFTEQRIAVVDDVMTSGATADAIASCLHQAGAKSVEIWVVARA